MTDSPTDPDPEPRRPPRRSLIELIAGLPDQVQDLVQREIELFKTEVTEKLRALGTGGGLLAGAAVTLLFMIGVLLTAAIFALSLVMPGWAAALCVAGVLLLTAAILALVGYRILQRGIPPIPSESIESIQRDIRAVRGVGKRAEEHTNE